MKRRTLLTWGAGVAACALAGYGQAVVAADGIEGHDGLLLADLEPDSMWSIYRRYRLMIVGQRDDEAALALARAVVDLLASYLPASRAQLARAADGRRVGVLIATNQQDVGIMAAESAEALFLAKPPFDDLKNVQLRLIAAFGRHVLVCRPDFMARDAYLVAQALARHKDALPTPARAAGGVVPMHRGSHAFFAGEEAPHDWNLAQFRRNVTT